MFGSCQFEKILYQGEKELKEEILGTTQTIEYGEHVVIGLDRKFLGLNDGKPIEFQAKITENGKIVLESECLTKLSKTGTDNFVKH